MARRAAGGGAWCGGDGGGGGAGGRGGALGLAGCLLADVGRAGLGGVARCGLGFALGLVASLGDVGEVVFVGDGAVLVFDALVGVVGFEPFLSGNGALVGVGVDAAGAEF